jgi:hypothetical protein
MDLLNKGIFMKKQLLLFLLIGLCVSSMVQSYDEKKIVAEWIKAKRLASDFDDKKEKASENLQKSDAGSSCWSAMVKLDDCIYFSRLQSQEDNHVAWKNIGKNDYPACQQLFETWHKQLNLMEQSEEFKEIYNALSQYYYYSVKRDVLESIIVKTSDKNILGESTSKKEIALAIIAQKKPGSINIFEQPYDARHIHEKIQQDLRTLVEQDM